MPAAPLLAVEVLSPSTRRVDLLLKRDRFEQAGVASYWLVDPDGPSVTVPELAGGTYRQVAAVGPGGSVRLSAPFGVRLAPDELPDARG